MTLILTRVANDGIVHVADRLVSVDEKAYDALRNKTVIFLARDGLAVASYTGIARLEDRWTDRWIAERLAGRDLGPIGGHQGTRLAAGGLQKSVGFAVLRLRDELSRVFPNLGRAAKERHAVHICGWQWPRGRVGLPRPFFWQIDNASGGSRFRVNQVLPRLLPAAQQHLIRSRQYIGQGRPEALMKQLEKASDLTEVRDILVGGIRDAASDDREKVGRDVVAVCLPQMGRGPIRVEFLSDVGWTATLQGERENQLVPVAFTPWIVAGDSEVPPQVFAGAGVQAVNMHGVSFEVGAPGLANPPSGLLLFTHGLPTE